MTAVDALRYNAKIADLSNLGCRRTSRLYSGVTLYGFERQRRRGRDKIAVDIMDLSLRLEIDAKAVLGVHLEAEVDGEVDIQ